MASGITKKQELQGKEGEDDLQKWFDDEGMAYVRITQNPETFAKLFRKDVKRPDFLLLIDSIGLIAVDAKSYSCSRDEFTLGIEQDLEKLLSYSQYFQQHVWLAYRGKEENTWYWISVLKAKEVGRKRKRKKDGKEFLALEKKYFAEIKSRDDIGKLCEQGVRMKSVRAG